MTSIPERSDRLSMADDDPSSPLPFYDPIPPQLDSSDLSASLEALQAWATAFSTCEVNSDLLADVIPNFVIHAAEFLTDIRNRKTSEEMIQRMCQSIGECMMCKICHNAPPRSPVVTGCGHIFCATCLRAILDRQVEAAIQSLSVTSDQLFYAVLPFETYEQQLRFEEAVRARGIYIPQPLTSYTCPCGKTLPAQPRYIEIVDKACRRLSPGDKPGESPLHEFRGLYPSVSNL